MVSSRIFHTFYQVANLKLAVSRVNRCNMVVVFLKLTITVLLYEHIEIFIPKILVDLLEDENCEAILKASNLQTLLRSTLTWCILTVLPFFS